MPGELAAGADQRAGLRVPGHHRGLVDILDLRAERPFQACDDRSGGGGNLALNELYRLRFRRIAGHELDDLVPGRNPVSLAEGGRFVRDQRYAIEQRAVLALQVGDTPGSVGTPGDFQVLPRKAVVVRVTQLHAVGPAENNLLFPFERKQHSLAVQVADDEFAQLRLCSGCQEA